MRVCILVCNTATSIGHLAFYHRQMIHVFTVVFFKQNHKLFASVFSIM